MNLSDEQEISLNFASIELNRVNHLDFESEDAEQSLEMDLQSEESISFNASEYQMIDQTRIQNRDELKCVLDEINCMICFNVVQQPQCCQICEAIFCKPCITKWFQSSLTKQVCPCCRSDKNNYQFWTPYLYFGGNHHNLQIPTELISNKVPKVLLKILSKIKLSCRNENCNEIIPYENIIKHEEICQFSLVPCINKDCEEFIIRKDLDQHHTICEFTKIQCIHCKSMQKKQQIKNHEQNCLYRVQLCQWCSEEQYLIELENHETECFMRKITCENCQNIFYLEQYKDHTSEQCFKALYLASQRKIQKLQQKQKDLEQIVIEQNLELQTLRQNSVKEKIQFDHQYPAKIYLINQEIQIPISQEVIVESIQNYFSSKDFQSLANNPAIQIEINLIQLDHLQNDQKMDNT